MKSVFFVIVGLVRVHGLYFTLRALAVFCNRRLDRTENMLKYLTERPRIG